MAKKSAAKPRKRSKKKKELTEEELALLAQKRRYMKRDGLWEVTIDEGLVIGYYAGSPEKIAAYVCANRDPAPFRFGFQNMQVQKVPETIVKENCCEKRFTKRDLFCSLCGEARTVEAKAPKDVEIDIDIV